VTISARLWALIHKYAEVTGSTPRWAFRTLLRRVEHLMDTCQLGVLDYDLEAAAQRLNSEGRLMIPTQEEQFLPLLHRTLKAKSGFVGVYASGNGFRAEGSDTVGKRIVIGTFPTAEQAALARFHHYNRLGLPYGELEQEIEALLKRDPTVRGESMERLKWRAIYEAAQAHHPIEGLTDEERALEDEDPDREALDAANRRHQEWRLNRGKPQKSHVELRREQAAKSSETDDESVPDPDPSNGADADLGEVNHD